MKALQKIYYSFVDVLFPNNCVVCNEDISNQTFSVCSDCLKRIDRAGERCQVCSGLVFQEEKCTYCATRRVFFDKNISLFPYSGVIKRMVLALKFNGKKKIINYFKSESIKNISKANLSIDYITSVPLIYKKEYNRGYNQVRILAKSIGSALKIKYKGLLYEKNLNLVQKKMNLKDRFVKVFGRFLPRMFNSISNKNILIVDDVFTSGATINECSRILKKMGAKKVFSLTIAIVDNRKSEYKSKPTAI